MENWNLTKLPNILKYISVDDLDLSSNQMHGTIKDWVWNKNCNYLNLSDKSLTSIEMSDSTVSKTCTKAQTEDYM
jgi:FlaG/FlaF family flagellin (archaellin)